MIEIKHHGAITGVTGSCHELSIESRHGGEHGILIDCGLFQGQEASGRASADDLAIDFPIEHIRALVVTHVHIDHTVDTHSSGIVLAIGLAVHKGEKKQLEDEVKAYIDAEDDQQLVVISHQGE